MTGIYEPKGLAREYADFDEGEVITNVILRRDLILSAMLKLTAERLGCLEG